MDILKALNWRYAVKEFDSSKKLTEEQEQLLLEATRLSASSYGQQPFKVLVIKNEDLRQQLVPHSYGQDKVAHASHLFVFAVDTKLSDESVDHFIHLVSKTRNIPVPELEGLGNMVKSVYQRLDQESKIQWATRQAYLALGNLLTVAALQEIDVCPMEGFDRSAFDQILQLENKGLKSVVICTLGFRSENDQLQYAAKVRKPLNEFVEVIN
ncbi:NAD(P)H-dependent oxidoreductase [Puteibacter caeruleilacunae]|nr:NAD(P)H-dependent oxidoreductase [Puteibacter caeruleilacunae]